MVNMAFTVNIGRPFSRGVFAISFALSISLSGNTFAGAVKAPSVSVSAASATVRRGESTAFIVKTNKVSTSALTISYAMSGTAILANDYTLSGAAGKVVMPAGATSATITIGALVKAGSSSTPVATLTLRAGTGFTLSKTNKASVKIVAPAPTPTPTPTPTPSPTPAATATPTPVPSPSPTATPASSRNVWIAVRSDGHDGSGTESDPYDGSIATKFDAIMADNSKTPVGTTIHFASGQTFQSNVVSNSWTGAWTVKSGWVWEGNGATLTLVGTGTGASNRHDLYGIFNVYDHPVDGVVIRNLNIDCNWAEVQNHITVANGEKDTKLMPIWLHGSNLLVENVSYKNSYGSLANQREQFGICLQSPSTGEGSNNVIRYCHAESPQGNYGAPFSLFGWVNFEPTHYLRNSSVYGCTATGNNNGLNPGFSTGGVNGAEVSGCSVHDNTFTDCQSVYYQDTGNTDGVEIARNRLIRGIFGVSLVANASSCSEKRNIQIVDNSFEIQNRMAGCGVGGFNVNGTPLSNVVISGNQISYTTTGAGLDQFNSFYCFNVNNAVLESNVSDPGNAFVQGSNITRDQNRQPDGAEVTAGGYAGDVSDAGQGKMVEYHNVVPGTLTEGTDNILRFNSSKMDKLNNYDASTGRFKPTVPGWYWIACHVFSGPQVSSNVDFLVDVYRDTTFLKRQVLACEASRSYLIPPRATGLVYFDGVNDYVEVHASQNSGNNVDLSTTDSGNAFVAYKVD